MTDRSDNPAVEHTDFSDFLAPDEVADTDAADDPVRDLEERAAALAKSADELASAEFDAADAAAMAASRPNQDTNQDEPPEAQTAPAMTAEELDQSLSAELDAALDEEGDPFGSFDAVESTPEDLAEGEEPPAREPPPGPQATPASEGEIDSQEKAAAAAEALAALRKEDAPSEPPRDEIDHVSPESHVRHGWSTEPLRLMRALSMPMRKLPESKRKYVDWFALSLAFWSPIVWLIALWSSQ